VCLNFGLQILSPSPIAGHYTTPSCEFNSNELNLYNTSIVRQVYNVDFDFCSEFEGKIENIAELVLLIGPNNCPPFTKGKFALQAGAKQVIIASRINPPGIEIHYGIYPDLEIFGVLASLYLYTVLSNAQNVTVLLTPDTNPFAVIFYGGLAPFYMSVLAFLSLICFILAARKLYYIVKYNKKTKKNERTGYTRLVMLSLECVYNLLFLIYNAVDPMFLTGYFPMAADAIFFLVTLWVGFTSSLFYNLCWLHYTHQTRCHVQFFFR